MEEVETYVEETNRRPPDFSGRECDVYLFHSFVVKRFHENREISNLLPQEDLKYLCAIPTKRILMPLQLFHFGTFGYIQKRISKLKPIHEILFQKNLPQEMELWKQDANLLSEHSFLLEDLNLNYLYNGELYLPDFGFFKRKPEMEKEELKRRNLIKLNFMWLSLFSSLYFTGYDAEELREDFTFQELSEMKKLGFTYYGDYLSYYFSKNDCQNYSNYYHFEEKKRFH